MRKGCDLMSTKKKGILLSFLMLTLLLGGCIRIQYDATIELNLIG